MSLRYQIVLLLLFLNLLASGGISVHTYQERKVSYYDHMDRMLQAGAYFALHACRDMAPREPTSAALDPEVRSQIERLLSSYTAEISTVETPRMDLYTVIEDHGKIFFTTVAGFSRPPDDEYLDAPQAVRLAFRTLTPQSIEHYRDRFGKWRSWFLPVIARDGKVYVVGADIPTAWIDEQVRKRLKDTLWIGALAFCLTTLLGLFMVGRQIRRLRGLAIATRTLAAKDFTPDEQTDRQLSALVRNGNNEIDILAGSVAAMLAALQRYLQELKTTTAAKEKIESELKIAHAIQLGLLPKLFPPFPNRSEFDLYAMIQPAREVGGDLYDFFWIDAHRLFFVIGDVSDKGVPAALLMAVTKTLLKTNMLPSVQLSDMLGKVNNDLSESNEALMFVTLFCAILDVRTGVVEYCDGGHNIPFLLSPGCPAKMIKKTTGIALGVSPGFQFQSDTLLLNPGDALFLYTDGVTEAMNGTRARYEDFRLQQSLTRMGGAPLPDLLNGVMSSVREFVADAPQSDDIAMLALRFRAPSPPVRE